MSHQPQPATEPQPQRKRPDLQAVRIPYWLTEKADDELTSWEQLVVYCWIFDHNGFALRNGGNIYGKHTYDTYHREITRDLNIRKPQPIIRKLIAAGWIAESWAAPFKGKTMKGYRCLLDRHQREDVRAEQQELQLRDEECETVVESVVQPSERQDWDGMYHYGGEHWYEEDGERHYVPAAEAYRRPSPRHVWDSEAVRWCLPEEVTVHPLDF